MSFTSWADVRPLVKRSAEECNAAYLEAIKPASAEVAWLFQTSVNTVLGSIFQIQENERWIEDFDQQYNRQQITRESYEGLRKIKQELISQEIASRDRCWNYAEGLKASAESLNLGLLQTAWVARGLRLAPALISKLIEKGASIDAVLPQSNKSALLLSYSDGYYGKLPATGALFPLMVKGGMQRTNELGRWAVRDKQLRLDFVRILIANIKDPKTINARAIDLRSGPTALAFAVEAGDDDLINLLLDAGADQRISNQEGKGVPGKTMIDIYAGKDISVIKRLSGVAIKFNRPDIGKTLDWSDSGGASSSVASRSPSNVLTSKVRSCEATI